MDAQDLPDARLRVQARQRDRAAEILHQAVVDGRLAVEELHARLPSALNAFTREDLYRVLIDLVPAAKLPEAVGEDAPLGTGPGMRWEDPLLIRSSWTGHKLKGTWEMPPFMEVISTGLGTVTLNCCAARPLSKVVDIVVSGNGNLTLIVPPGWGVDVQQISTWGQNGSVNSSVPSRPIGDHPRLILRGSLTGRIRVREAKPRELKRAAINAAKQRELTAGQTERR